MAASKSTLEALHDALATEFAKILKDGVTRVVDGEVVKETPSPAMLSAIRQFLKDNNIEALLVPGSPLGNVVKTLPFAGRPISPEDEETLEPPTQH